VSLRNFCEIKDQIKEFSEINWLLKNDEKVEGALQSVEI
jgi:hypothetical protein